jgi:putative endonuclease
MNYAYILRCGDGSLYTGWTNNLEKRLAAHNRGKGSKYTRSRLPVEVGYYEEFSTKIAAQRCERAIKKLTHSQKEALILSFK